MNVLLCITGSVSCILASKLAAELSKFASVRIAVTNSAARFLSEENFKTDCEVFSDSDELKWVKRGDSIYHIDLGKWADVLVVAPLTANSLAKFACGLADNLVSNLVRAWDFAKPAIFAVSMNPRMYNSVLTKQQISLLNSMGCKFVAPQVKTMMCGDVGLGALADISKIIEETKLTAFRNFCENTVRSPQGYWTEVNITQAAKQPRDKLWLDDLEASYNSGICGGYLEDRSAVFDARHDKGKAIHLGVDFWAHAYTTVRFPYGFAGKVLSVTNSKTKGGWGGRVDIAFEYNGKILVAIFAHLGSIRVEAGQTMEKGQIIGYIAATENNGGWKPHLHLQVMTQDYYHSVPDFDAYAAAEDSAISEARNPIYLN